MGWQVSSTCPINPIHAALLRSGKVLFFTGSGNDPAKLDEVQGTAVWDVNAGTFSRPSIPIENNKPVVDLFCAGHSFRPDGKLMVAGGTLQYDPFKGSTAALLFNPSTDQWERVASMNRGRWYPTVVTLSDGRIFALSGFDVNGNLDTYPEIYSPSFGWRAFSRPTSRLPMYSHLLLLSNGRLFYSGGYFENTGVSPRILTLPSRFDRAISEQAVPGLQDANFGEQAATVLLPPAQDQRVMIIGGGNGFAGTATNRVNVVDLKVSNPTYTAAAPLNHGRMHHNAVILPDRTVFVCNGSRQGENVSQSNLPAEIYNPATNTWRVVETPTISGRVYHSVALLLPDGRVVTAGGNPDRNIEERRIEIYSPAYMSQTRPTIQNAPSTVGYGGTFTLQTPQAGNTKWVSLIRPMATTHSCDTEQRLVDLPINSRTSTSLTVAVTSNRNIAPPGYYMLFITDNNNVPSVARWIQLT